MSVAHVINYELLNVPEAYVHRGQLGDGGIVAESSNVCRRTGSARMILRMGSRKPKLSRPVGALLGGRGDNDGGADHVARALLSAWSMRRGGSTRRCSEAAPQTARLAGIP